MKKKILALVASLFMVFSLVGCNKEGASLLQNLQEVSSWPGMEQIGSMEVNAELNDKKFGITLDYVAETANGMQMEMNMNIKKIEVDGNEIDTTADKDKKIPAVKCYMDGAKFYVGTALLKQVSELTGEKLPEKIDMTKEYLVLDLSDVMKQSGIDMSKEGVKELNEKTYKQLRDSDVKLPIEQDSQKYTVELSAKQMVEAGSKYTLETVKANKTAMTEQYKKLGLTDDQIDKAFEQTTAICSGDMQAQLIKAMDGSKAKLVYTFDKDEDKYTVAMDCDLKFAQENQTMTLAIKANSKVERTGNKVISFPSSVTTCKMDEVMAMVNSAATSEAKTKDEVKDETKDEVTKDETTKDEKVAKDDAAKDETTKETTTK